MGGGLGSGMCLRVRALFFGSGLTISVQDVGLMSLWLHGAVGV